MKTKKFLLLLVMQILVALPLVAQELYTELEREMFGEPSELFINDIVAKPIKASTLNARDGDSINDYQAERQFIDDYLKQINPNFSAGELKVRIGLTQKKNFLFEVLYRGIIVDKHKITLHQFTDTTMLITGTTLFNNDINVEPTLTLDQAVKKLQLQNNKITDESILSNKLVIYKALGGEPCLCYKLEVLIDPFEHYYYYVSAVNGNVIWRSTLTRIWLQKHNSNNVQMDQSKLLTYNTNMVRHLKLYK